MAIVVALAACGGGGGGGDDDAPLTISGQAVFESVPANGNGSLNHAGASDKPVRGATVQLLDAGNAVLATTSTDEQGNYSVVLAASQPVTVRVRAEMKRTGTASGDRDFTVLDNTGGDALYVLDSAAFTPAANTTQNLRAASGWGGSSYTSTRAAAPFAILDAVYVAQVKIASVAPTTTLPPLKVFWSVNNRPVEGDRSDGEIVTTSFTTTASGRALFVLGSANVDTDEYDGHVIAHEFGHYLQNALSRDDNMGGRHGNDDKLDMRVAFSEGWGNAWSGIALGSPVYAGSYGTGQANGFTIDVSVAATGADQGWFSETAAQYLIWKANELAGFPAIYGALTGLTTSPAFSSLYSFAASVKAASPANSAAITALWATQQVVAQDAFGAGETNNGGNPASLPVYKNHTAALGASQNYCVNADADPRNEGNKLGEYVFVRFTASGTRTLTVTRTSPAGAAGTDPDFTLLKSDGSTAVAFSDVADVETLSNVALPTGSHAIALTDFRIVERPATSSRVSCFDFKVSP